MFHKALPVSGGCVGTLSALAGLPICGVGVFVGPGAGVVVADIPAVGEVSIVTTGLVEGI